MFARKGVFLPSLSQQFSLVANKFLAFSLTESVRGAQGDKEAGAGLRKILQSSDKNLM